jgi:Clp amino terminal domain, pathogenicity island component/ClpX C4-type zinc finger
MFDRFSDQARRLVVQAQEEVRVLRHTELDAAHLLLAIAALPDSDATAALTEMGIATEAVRDGARAALGPDGSTPTVGSISFTPRAMKTLERGLEESERLHDDFVGTAHLLLGLVRAKKGAAALVLHDLGVDLDRARATVAALPSGESNAGVSLHRETTVAGSTGTGQAAEHRIDSVPAATPFPPPMTGFSPNNQRCSFCGRDLWDSAHFVHGDGGAICDECVTAARRVIDDAADDQHGLTLPPRVFGTIPDPEAARMIDESFRTVFGTFATPVHRERLIEDGTNVARFLEEAQASTGIRVQGARVQRVRFVDARRAEVQFALDLSGMSWLPFDGNAVHHDGQWLVGRDTIGRVVERGGVQLPPRAP